MHQVRKRRLIALISALSLGAVVIGLVLYAMRQNISLFYTPMQVQQGEAPRHHPIRVGGMVVKGSLHYLEAGRRLEFDITDFKATLHIQYQGLLPDLFREGQGVVINGELQEHGVIATQVLAKHDEKYMPPELRGMVRVR